MDGMTLNPESANRRDWMGLLARAGSSVVIAAMGKTWPEHRILRGPEIGLVMVQGRTGGTGTAFNLGEVTVTRCSVELPCGAVGHSVVQGRNKDHARAAAVLDAVLQGEGSKAVETGLLAALRQAETDRRTSRAAKAAATRVEFFTLQRGED
jgi:alpha-D-ribose 1-methylphosphonate 5-triphosphate synthase subunit PhnG